ncbi:MAG: ATP-binding domain-containing protein, partial [Bacteroidales bacterium]|nr:ATP-binding domain-containing protein [Candidatus Sodaliphilus limicaballi]
YKGKGLINLINGLLEDSGLKQLYRNDEDEERLENINELLESIHFYEKEHFEDEDFSIVNYLQDIALFTNADYRQDSSTVKLMTIHQAKGLEFPYIYIVALTEGLFPSHRSIRERKQKALEEERRLMYVAITRAKTRLFLTESGGYSYTTGDKYPSRFITEIKDKLLNFEGDFDTSLFENTRLISKNLDIELYGVSTTGEFKPGTFVKNPVLGIGEVIENYPDSNSCKVKFSNITIPIHYPHLTIITIESKE